jgi:hypothetical protein
MIGGCQHFRTPPNEFAEGEAVEKTGVPETEHIGST